MLDEGNKFPQQEIFVARMAIVGIDIETCFACRCYDQEFAELMPLPEIFGEIPAARANEGLLVVAKAVQEIQDGIMAIFVGVVAWRQKRAVGNLFAEDFAF